MRHGHQCTVANAAQVGCACPRRFARWRGAFAALAIALASQTAGDVFVRLTSYEAQESDLKLTPHPGDASLALSIVSSGFNGAPPASDGARMLRIHAVNEADHKVEFTHTWNSTWYDLAGYQELLVDFWVTDLGFMPATIGVYDDAWSPPDAWAPAAGLPLVAGEWKTLSFALNGRTQVDRQSLAALVLENFPLPNTIVYIDNLRFRRTGGPLAPRGVAANGYAHGNEITWKGENVIGTTTFRVWRATASGGPFTPLTPPLPAQAGPFDFERYFDAPAAGGPRYYYRVTANVNGVESPQSATTFAQYNGLTDDQMLDLVQEAAFGYFWDGAHPSCGLAREGIGLGHPPDTVTTGGTGFGLATLVVGAERGFVTRTQAAARVLTILTFLDEDVARYRGAWAHHYHGVTGATIPFSAPQDNGGDIVETAFLVQGLLICRQYFDHPTDPVEAAIRARAGSMWEGVEWSGYTKPGDPETLYWNWSPNFGFAINVPVRGYNETMIAYLLAVASPTHPIPATAYQNGWAGPDYLLNQSYLGRTLKVGWPLGGRLFFTHYSNIGFDPRWKHDPWTNYAVDARSAALIHQAYSAENPHNFALYSPLAWGLTSSADPAGYREHEPANDNGTLSPTAAVCSIPYTPAESLAAIRHLYDVYGFMLNGPYGFFDAINLSQGWVAPGYLAIDQGPMAPMIENYRSELCWRLFMSSPEIRPARAAMGFFFEVDYGHDDDIDSGDLFVFTDAMNGPGRPTPPPGSGPTEFALSDLDDDLDVDMTDTAVVQRLCGQ